MTDPTPKQLVMARRIAASQMPPGHPFTVAVETGNADHFQEVQIALAAIIEMSERIERMLDKCNDPCPQCWEAFSKGDHLDD